jgi:hypothetical protein
LLDFKQSLGPKRYFVERKKGRKKKRKKERKKGRKTRSDGRIS